MRYPRLILSALVFSLAIAACNPASPTNPPTVQSPVALAVMPADTATPTPQPTATLTPTLTDTPSPSQTPTPPADMLPPFLASTPGIAETLTAAWSTPGAVSTFAAQQTQGASTVAAIMPGFSANLLSQCPNPTDPPKQIWVNIPVMPQATAGQVVQTLIGSYYCFRAPVTFADMESFYKQKLPPPGWMLQSDANGAMIFVGFTQTQFQMLILNSGPGNKNDLIVAINITHPLTIPIPTPKK